MNEKAADSYWTATLAPSAGTIFVLLTMFCTAAPISGRTPFTFERSIDIPGVPVGPYSDSVAVDVARRQLYATPQAAKSVAVLSLTEGRVLKMIGGFGNPHGMFFSATHDRLYVTDGEAGNVKVFDASTHALSATIRLKKGADCLSADPSGNRIYVNNGGEDAGMDHSLISMIDVATMRKVGEVSVPSLDLESSVVDPENHRLYVNMADKHAVAVVDLVKFSVVATWPIGRCDENMAMALDAGNGRLYVGCRNKPMHGSIAVVRLIDGSQWTSLPIGGLVDSVYFDTKRQRIYASTGIGHLETYQVLPNGKFRRRTPMDTAVMAKTSLYSVDLDRMLVSVPHIGTLPAQVMIFAPVD